MIDIINTSFSKNEISLHLLNGSHLNGLMKISTDSRIWESAPLPYFRPEVFKEQWFNKALKQMNEKKRIAFVIYHNNQAIGSTSYYAIDEENKKLKMGYTWLHPSHWGTNANALCKFLLLEHVFETLYFNRVEFSIDDQNYSSCKSLDKFGVNREGTIRNDMILPNGKLRNSVIYSVIAEEWPTIKRNIENLVQPKSFTEKG